MWLVATTLDRQETSPSSEKFQLDSTGLVGQADTLYYIISPSWNLGGKRGFRYFREEEAGTTWSVRSQGLNSGFSYTKIYK